MEFTPICCPFCSKIIEIPMYDNISYGVDGTTFSGYQFKDCGCDDSKRMKEEIWRNIKKKLDNLNVNEKE